MPTQAELEGSVSFILYELWMLRSCAEMPRPNDRVVRNLWYEGLALHARVLRDFFFTKVDRNGNRATHPTDVAAIDYFSSATKWPHTSDTLPQYLLQNKERMDRALAHLSTDRIAYEQGDKDWNANALKSEVFMKWFEFMRTLSVDNPTAAAWFRGHRRARLVPFEP